VFAIGLTHLLFPDDETHLIEFELYGLSIFRSLHATPMEKPCHLPFASPGRIYDERGHVCDKSSSDNVANQCFFVDCESVVFAIGLTHLIEFELYGLSVFRSLHRWKSNVTYPLLRPVEYTMSADKFDTNVLPAMLQIYASS
jgi:hypothetical protein